jgi:hypothetical protein
MIRLSALFTDIVLRFLLPVLLGGALGFVISHFTFRRTRELTNPISSSSFGLLDRDSGIRSRKLRSYYIYTFVGAIGVFIITYTNISPVWISLYLFAFFFGSALLLYKIVSS